MILSMHIRAEYPLELWKLLNEFQISTTNCRVSFDKSSV